jgi:hypothetical protein
MDGTRSWTCRRAGKLAVAALALGTMGRLAAAADAPQPQDVRVARLIRELGARDYVVRERADAELASLGRASRAQLEQALTHQDVEVRLRAKRLLDHLKLDELWDPAVVEPKAKGQLASTVLAALAAQSGNHIHVGDPYGSFAEKRLESDLAPTSYWQAVDEICLQSGNRIRPHYDMHTPGIVVSAGTPPLYPRAYGGPVRGQITGARRVFIEELNYDEHKAELTHSFQVNLQFTWEDRFSIVGYATQPELVEAVTDNHVICSASQPAGGGWNATTRGLRQVTASIKLNPVPVSAKAFDVFTVRWGLIAVGEPAVLEIEHFDPQRVHAQDDLAARVESIEKQSASKYAVTVLVTRDLALPEPHEVIFQEYEVELLDADGRKFRVQSQTPSLSDRGVLLKLTFAGESPDSQPKRLRLHYPRLRSRRDVELSFRDVPLPTGKPE